MTASNAPFAAGSVTITVAASSTSQRAALPTGAGSQLRPVNPSSGLLYVKTGAANVTADSNALPLLPSSSEIVTVDGAATNIATYASATAGPLLVTRGEGR
jgi:hypothetical protein